MCAHKNDDAAEHRKQNATTSTPLRWRRARHARRPGAINCNCAASVSLRCDDGDATEDHDAKRDAACIRGAPKHAAMSGVLCAARHLIDSSDDDERAAWHGLEGIYNVIGYTANI